ncbi:hypothetical protein AAFC00_002173 [Neodothiora populina]|uniref:Pescadillo homolog n=1 Tax=Neodothiora populina TaxID=2781224 RepID=A0ABR3PGI6_9PEZI
MVSQKKGNKKEAKKGNAKNYITRTQAVRKLQISLPDFRRLCIFKGIYPREPRNKRKAAKNSTPSTTFYYTRDIQFLLHEPLLAKYRDHKALGKKISRALGRNEIGDAARMEKTLTPRITLDHVIKERYPTFVDALRDLDDCLSMLFLFANLPATENVSSKTIQLCQRLCLEFEHYLIRTNSLRKSFLSIKGIYYQATIQGQDILWLVPYKFVQRVTGDVDFRIMATFVDFYTTLLGFVNYRLYTSAGLVYPPKFNAQSDEQGAELTAFTIQGANQAAISGDAPATTQDGAQKQISQKAQAEADKLLSGPAASQEEPTSSYATANELPSSSATVEAENGDETTTNADGLDKFETVDQSADQLYQPTGLSQSTASTLFSDMTIFLSRETPRAPLEFILRSFGCNRLAWDAILGPGAYTNDESDRRITHQIVDRPDLPLPAVPDEDEEQTQNAVQKGRLRPGERVPGRIYVQPQWVWDSINAGRLLRPDLYAPGAALPPHLSPWVKARKGEYDPTKPLAEQEAEGEAVAAGADVSDEEVDDEDMEELEAASADEEEKEEEEEDPSSNVRSMTPAEYREAKEKAAKEKEYLAKSRKDIASGEGMDVELADSEDEDDESEEEEADEAFDGFEEDASSDDDDDDAAAARQHQRELEAEAKGQTVSTNKTDAGSTPGKALKKKEGEQARKKMDKARKEKDEEVERQKMMMSRRKRKVFEKMTYSNNKRDAEAEKLRSKRRKLEKQQQK